MNVLVLLFIGSDLHHLLLFIIIVVLVPMMEPCEMIPVVYHVLLTFVVGADASFTHISVRRNASRLLKQLRLSHAFLECNRVDSMVLLKLSDSFLLATAVLEKLLPLMVDVVACIARLLLSNAVIVAELRICGDDS